MAVHLWFGLNLGFHLKRRTSNLRFHGCIKGKKSFSWSKHIWRGNLFKPSRKYHNAFCFAGLSETRIKRFDKAIFKWLYLTLCLANKTCQNAAISPFLTNGINVAEKEIIPFYFYYSTVDIYLKHFALIMTLTSNIIKSKYLNRCIKPLK